MIKTLEIDMAKFSLFNFLVIAATLLGVGLGASTAEAHDKKKHSTESAETTAAKEEAGRTAITGGFELLDHAGKVVRSEDFRGSYMLVYLGYTFCPDICPTDLQAMTEALELMGDKADRIQPIFITIDPARDTPEVVGEYISNFHPRLIGLTGNADQVGKATTAYGAKFYKVFAAPMQDEDDGEEGDDASTDEDYLLNHSAATYLMGPDGEYIGHFSQGSEAQGMAEQLSQIIE